MNFQGSAVYNQILKAIKTITILVDKCSLVVINDCSTSVMSRLFPGTLLKFMLHNGRFC